jgi:hypothetical protein
MTRDQGSQLFPENSSGADQRRPLTFSRPFITVGIFLNLFLLANSSGAAARQFDVADDVDLTTFENAYTGHSDPVFFSPDQRYFVVITNRGRRDINRCESSLRIWLTSQVQYFLSSPTRHTPPAPFWVVSQNTSKYGPVITHVQWLRDSSGVAFLAKTAVGTDRLFLADVRSKKVQALTPDDQHVTGFDVRDRRHFVYSILSPQICKALLGKPSHKSVTSASVEVTDSAIHDLFHADIPPAISLPDHDHSNLWAVLNGHRFVVRDSRSHRLITLFWEGEQALALSPDGKRLITSLPVKDVPREWESLYKPRSDLPPSSPWRIRAGPQDLEKDDIETFNYVSEYALINLQTGKSDRIVGAPTGHVAGWWSYVRASWSSDGRLAVLTNTFLRAAPQSHIDVVRPCVALVDFSGPPRASCIRYFQSPPKDETQQGYIYITDAQFTTDKTGCMTIKYFVQPTVLWGSATYCRAKTGEWIPDVDSPSNHKSNLDLDVTIKQSLSEPPVLLVTKNASDVSRVLWDPNPLLHSIDLGDASLFKWKDKAGHAWTGGLYKPRDFTPRKRYPVVVQTHGFVQDQFNASGLYTTGYAARELNTRGIVVLQVPDCSMTSTPEEAMCNVDGYEAGVRQLIDEGVADSERIGIMGFSLSGYYVLEALTFGEFSFKAATVNDSTSVGYWAYLASVDVSEYRRYCESVIGSQPFGQGFQLWGARSPEFNLDKVQTPLLITANGQESEFGSWGDYAGLRILGKPVDLVVVDDYEHVLTNPAARIASQGLNVDWFDFWLNGHEEKNRAKEEQYKRWHKLRSLVNETRKRDQRESQPTSTVKVTTH